MEVRYERVGGAYEPLGNLFADFFETGGNVADVDITAPGLLALAGGLIFGGHLWGWWWGGGEEGLW